MKIGTFVGQENLVISKEVVEIIKKEAVTAAKKLIGDFNGGFKVKVTNSPMSYSKGTHLFITLQFNDNETYRYKNGNKYKPEYISISIFFQKGYDQSKTGPSYTWEKGFKPICDLTSYNCSINLMGDLRFYRTRTIHHCGICKTIYTYGTELADLDVRNGIVKVAEYINNSTISKF